MTKDATVIGRREDADFRIPLSDVSRKHCRLVKDGSALLLEDLNSSNGTHRNGDRVQKSCELEAGDVIRIGPIQFVVQIDGTPTEDELDVPKPARSASPRGDGSMLNRTFTPPPEAPSFENTVVNARGVTRVAE
ncbi:MAG: FHA domain-containing protein [Tepidisphaeraceae bacterium]